MDRRQFISGAASVALSHPLHGNADRSDVSLKLVPPDKTWIIMPADFIGLSYESQHLLPDSNLPRDIREVSSGSGTESALDWSPGKTKTNPYASRHA